MSLSTVIALKLWVTPFERSACRTGAATGASVMTKESIVAMSGAIMPAPLAMPLIVTVASPNGTVRVASLGKVSVVMIARAASGHRSAATPAAILSTTRSNFAGSSGSPITPVEAR